MPLLYDITNSAMDRQDIQAQIDSIIRQLNEWGRRLSNESETAVQYGSDGSIKIVQGVQHYGKDDAINFIGTLYYNKNDLPGTLIGLAPDDQRNGIWVGNDDQDVINLLTS